MIKILIVEDQLGLLDVLKDTFISLGYNTYGVTTAQDALQFFMKERPEILFIDINLPDKNGLELLSEIKKIDPNNVAIILSSDDNAANRKKALEVGAVDFISKPFYTELLRTCLFHNLVHLKAAVPKHKPKILIADDEADIANTLSRYIEKHIDADIFVAYDGHKASEILNKETIDVAFMDVRMPIKNGLSVISEHLDKNTNFIVVTGDMSTELLQGLKKLGIKNYFGKPLEDITPLFDHLKAVLIAKNKFIPK